MTTESPSGQLGEELVRLASADNFRDVAGPGLRAVDGTPLRAGVFYRSNELQLTDVDVRALHGLRIGGIYDLRSRHEVTEHPDTEVPGAQWRHLEIGGIPMDTVSSLESREAAVEVMRAVYRSFVEVPAARASYAALLTALHEASPEQAHVFHCTAGKDRTGWAAALLLHNAGCSADVVLADYLRTNEFGGTRDKYLALVREHLGEEKVAVYEAVMVADADYLRAAHDAVAARYGDLAAYLREGLGLDEEVLAGLRARLRQEPNGG
ncbi:tyrosine-protein phosphatase [Nocardioides sp. SYSU D00038]|uniref:tyrosine-protein phosphatase n=1 Tax=Nocardioides sp. SYSU D00038 TaxID=2812554 RepID=UPI001967D673|nr:tyrosine-protein phosphatase [Nocardioides sp. SYSU D00038]